MQMTIQIEESSDFDTYCVFHLYPGFLSSDVLDFRTGSVKSVTNKNVSYLFLRTKMVISIFLRFAVLSNPCTIHLSTSFIFPIWTKWWIIAGWTTSIWNVVSLAIFRASFFLTFLKTLSSMTTACYLFLH